MSETNSNQDFKRRRKRKSVIGNAKKYGKKGRFGRGSHVDQSTYEYFIQVLELTKKEFDTPEEKETFITNTLDQTIDHEVEYSCNQLGSRVIETLLHSAKDEILQRYFTALGENLRPIISDNFASHIIQTLLKIAAKKYFELNEDCSSNIFAQWILKVSKFTLNNLEDFVWDIYGNHVIRNCLEALGGIESTVQGNKGITVDDCRHLSETLPEEFKSTLKDFAIRLSAWPQFKDMPFEEGTSGLIQTLVICLKGNFPEINIKIFKQLLEESFIDEECIWASESCPRLLEVCLFLCGQKLFKKIYKKLFVGSLVKKSLDKKKNFTVQKLLTNCKDPELFVEMFDELAESFNELIEAKHTGVLVGLANGCKNNSQKQGQFIQTLVKTLNTNDEQIVSAVVKIAAKESQKVSLHGSLLVQVMLTFNKPIKIINSLLSLPIAELEELLCDQRGCHIGDGFLSSQFVGEKSRDRLFKKLNDSWLPLACSKHGSRVVDAIWAKMNNKSKELMIQKLAAKDHILLGNSFGKIIANKYGVSLYKRKKEDWINWQSKSNLKQELFKDIISV